MKDLEILELAVNSIRYRSLRSWLAILGVVIGVASIISLISISTGLNAQISSQLGGLGANIITISSGSPQAMRGGFGQDFRGGPATNPLTFKDAEGIKGVAGVYKVDARLSRNLRVAYRTKNASMSVVGTDPQVFPASSNAQILLGRALRASDANAAVIGFSVMNQTFEENLLDKSIKIDGKPFRVVGILNASGAMFGGPDDSVFINIDTAKSMFGQSKNASSIVVIAANGTNTDEVAGNVTNALLKLHRISADKQDFRAQTASSMQATMSSVTGTLGLFLGVIASISLIVGGIGVANAMFTSVLEQTKYIGVLKSLGARRIEIMKLFLFEACLVGLVGGVLGVTLSFVASLAMAQFNIPTKITPDLVALGMIFSVGVGAVSGVFPARNAASVAPVEALRYE